MAKRDACDVFNNLPASSEILDKFPTLLSSLFQAKVNAREIQGDTLGKELSLELMEGDDDKKSALLITSSDAAGCLPEKECSHAWILRDNRPQDRMLRKRGMDMTLEACCRGGFFFDGRFVCLRNIAPMRASTEFISARMMPRTALGPWRIPQRGMPSWFMHASGTAADVAIACQHRRCRVALVSAGSAFSAGGGCRRGSRHAMEESLCVRSTLFQSLMAAETLQSSDEDGAQLGRYIPQDAVILSRDVEFFRGSTTEGYPFWESVEQVAAVITVAMPNCNSNVKDAPVDAPRDRDAYVSMLKDQFSAVLAAAVRAQVRVLVIPDAGCGAYGNDATDVGSIFGDTLRQGYLHCFEEIHLVGQRAFADAALQRGTLSVPVESRPRRRTHRAC